MYHRLDISVDLMFFIQVRVIMKICYIMAMTLNKMPMWHIATDKKNNILSKSIIKNILITVIQSDTMVIE